MHLKRAGLTLRVGLAFSAFFCSAFNGWSTHQRAGHIVYRHLGGYTYEFFIYTWMYAGSPVPPQRTELPIWWGDGYSDSLVLIQIIDDPFTASRLQIYHGTYTFPGAHTYTIYTEDPNRDSGIVNIPNSLNLPIYLESSLVLYADTNIMRNPHNSSPVMLDPGVVTAVVGVPFFFMPVAYDPDGDSLTFELDIPRTTGGIPVPGYQLPDAATSAPDVFTINPQTGLVAWSTPPEPGHFNFAVRIKEYRNNILVGSVLRDVRIIVREGNNRLPRITAVQDTCVWAGDTLRFHLRAYDPDFHPIRVLVTGDVFPAAYEAPQVLIQQIAEDSADIWITWPTHCADIRSQPYTFIVQVRDSPPSLASLATYTVWRVRVLAPPDTATLSVQNTFFRLDWGPSYACSGHPGYAGFAVWRRIGLGPPLPDSCFTDLGSLGYQRISRFVQTYQFDDYSVSPGNVYCYRIQSEFFDTVFFRIDTLGGFPSWEVCDTLPWIIPILLNVSVERTDTFNGKIFLRWRYPPDIDTIVYPPPYRLELYRGQGFNPASWNLLYVHLAPTLTQLLQDTIYIDTPVNTASFPWSYRLRFFVADTVLVGETPIASSVYLRLLPQDQQMGLVWQANVPWMNFGYLIYRKDPNSNVFVRIDSVGTTFYVDTGLRNGLLYCYQIYPALGKYTLLPDTLENNSQVACARPVDLQPPCPPTLHVTDPCQATEYLADSAAWIPVLYYLDPECAPDAYLVILYRKRPGTDWQPVDTQVVQDWSGMFLEGPFTDITTCYAAVAMDSSFNLSTLSDSLCLQNCPYYILPSAFSPNGDGIEDIFHPILPYRFITRVAFTVYNRWGDIVFQTNDPWLGWNGTDLKGNPLPTGVYYYHCVLFVQTWEGLVPWGEPLRGSIYLRRD